MSFMHAGSLNPTTSYQSHCLVLQKRSLEQDHRLFDLDSSWDEWKKLAARAAMCKVQLRAEVGGPEGTGVFEQLRAACSQQERRETVRWDACCKIRGVKY